MMPRGQSNCIYPLSRLVLILGCLWVVAWPVRELFAVEPHGDQPSERAQRLERMLQRAQGMSLSADKAEGEFEMIPQPVFRYDDQPRRILDATLWAWKTSGRPRALCKIEDYQRETSPLWVYCLTSLSPDLIQADWKTGRHWQATKPGIELRAIPNGPKPAGTAPLQLRQIRKLSRRFSATLLDPRDESRQAMRLLPQPIVQYHDEKTGLTRGAIFGLASNGTNPDAVVLIELHTDANEGHLWKYAVAGMTASGVELRLDEEKVWTKKFTPDPNQFGNWMFFSVPQEP